MNERRSSRPTTEVRAYTDVEFDAAEERRRRRERALIVAIAVFSTLLLVGVPRLMRQERITAGPGDLILWLLINLNAVLILLMLFLLIRNVVKLVFERRRGVLGSKLRAKLVLAFVLLSLAPTIFLFTFAVRFVSQGLDDWFDKKVEESLEGALEVAQVFYKEQTARLEAQATYMSRWIRDERLLKQDKLGVLEAYLELKRAEFVFGSIDVIGPDGDPVMGVLEPNGSPPLDRAGWQPLVDAALEGRAVTRVVPVEEDPPIEDGADEGAVQTVADLVQAAVPIFSTYRTDEPVAVLVVSQWVPQSLDATLRRIERNFTDYKHFAHLEVQVKQVYTALFVAVTLLVIFAATWFGFYFSKSLTGPVGELAAATQRVASGDLDVQLVATADDEIGSLVHSFNAMTEELRQSHAELEDRRRYTETVLRHVAAGVVSVDQRGRVTTLNKSAERLLDVKAKDSLDRPYRVLLESDQRSAVRHLVRELGQARQDTIERQIQLFVRGQSLTLLASVTRLRDEEGNFFGLVFVFEDLTQLLKAQRMAAWREVARRIAHEIKNPLTPIQLSAQRIQNRYQHLGEEGEVLQECTGTIVSQVEELKALVNEFTNFARMPAANPRPNELNEIVAEALTLHETGHEQIQFTTQLDPDLPRFNIDGEQMKRAVINLVENAVQALGGDPGEIEVSTHFNKLLDIARIEISDSGPGIPPEIRPRLFEPYFSTKRGGSGLGLAIVSTIVADHSGYIRLRDRKPHGTTFVIELPIRT